MPAMAHPIINLARVSDSNQNQRFQWRVRCWQSGEFPEAMCRFLHANTSSFPGSFASASWECQSSVMLAHWIGTLPLFPVHLITSVKSMLAVAWRQPQLLSPVQLDLRRSSFQTHEYPYRHKKTVSPVGAGKKKTPHTRPRLRCTQIRLFSLLSSAFCFLSLGIL